MDTREALEKSIVLWDWLADNPGEPKQHGLLQCFPNDRFPLYNCFLCESVKFGPTNQEVPNCTKCPVWPTTDEDDGGCETEGSPYAAWAYNPKNTEAARAVASLCRKALEKLK